MDPKELESNEHATDPNADTDMVEVHQASIEDLDAALANAQAEETPAPLETDSGDTVNEDPNANASEKPAGQPAPTAKVADAEVAPQGADASKPAQKTPDEIQAIQAENERLKKQGDQKELFIQQRGTELGTLKTQLNTTRGQLNELLRQLSTGLEERFQENPLQANNDRDRIKEIKQQLDGLDNHEERVTSIVEAQTYFLRHVDTEQVNVDDVAAVLAADGLEERYVNQFKSNPWEFTTPEALVQMGKRAMDRKHYAQAHNDRVTLAKYVNFLKAENAKLKGKPAQVISNLQRGLNQAPPVTSASASSPKTDRDVNPVGMSIAQLDAALRNSMVVVN